MNGKLDTKFTIRTKTDLKQALEEEARRQRRSFAFLVNDILEEWITRKKRLKK